MLKPDKDKVKNGDPLGILGGNGKDSQKTNDPLGILKKKDLTTPIAPSSQPLETGGQSGQGTIEGSSFIPNTLQGVYPNQVVSQSDLPENYQLGSPLSAQPTASDISSGQLDLLLSASANQYSSSKRSKAQESIDLTPYDFNQDPKYIGPLGRQLSTQNIAAEQKKIDRLNSSRDEEMSQIADQGGADEETIKSINKRYDDLISSSQEKIDQNQQVLSESQFDIGKEVESIAESKREEDKDKSSDSDKPVLSRLEMASPDDANYVELKRYSKNKNEILDLISPKFAGMEEEDAVIALKKRMGALDVDFQYLDFQESGATGDYLTIVNKFTGDEMEFFLDNDNVFSQGMDRDQSNKIRSYIDVQMEFPEYTYLTDKIRKMEYEALGNPELFGITQNEYGGISKRKENAWEDIKSGAKYRANPTMYNRMYDADNQNLIALNKNPEYVEAKRQLSGVVSDMSSYSLKDDDTAFAFSKMKANDASMSLGFDKVELDRAKYDQSVKQELYDQDMSSIMGALDSYRDVGTGQIDFSQVPEEEKRAVFEKISSLEQDLGLSNELVSDITDDINTKQENINKVASSAAIAAEDFGTPLSDMKHAAFRGLVAIPSFVNRVESTFNPDVEVITKDDMARFIGGQGVTEEYSSSEDRAFAQKVLVSLTESISTAVSSGGLLSPQTAFTLSSTVDALEQMDDPAFDDISSAEKWVYSGIYGTAMGALENLGFSKSISKTPAGKAAIRALFHKTLKELPKDASLEMLETSLKETARATILKGGLDIVTSSIAEGGTEYVQEGVDATMKLLYNKIRNEDLFETYDSFAEFNDSAWEQALMGAAGGGMMQGTTKIINGKASTWDKKAVEMIDRVINGESSKSFNEYLSTLVAKGEMTQEEAESKLKSADQTREIFESIPETVKGDGRYDAFSLIAEKKEIENQIQGKERSLVTAESERLTQINQDLKTIGDKATRKKLVETLEEDLRVEKESEFGGNEETIKNLESQVSSLKEVDIDPKQQGTQEQQVEETTVTVPVSENIEVNTVEGAETEYKIDDGFYKETEFIEKLNDPDFMSQVENGEVVVQVQNPSSAVESLILTEKTVQNEVQQTQEAQNQAQDTEVDPLTQQTQSDLGFEPQGATIAPTSGQNSRQKKFVLQAEAETAIQAVKQMILSGIRLDKAVMKKELGLTDSEIDSKKGLFTSTKSGGAKTVSVDGMIEVLKSSNPSFFEQMDDSDIRQMIIDLINDNNSTSELQQSLTDDFTVDGVIYEKINDRSGAQNFSQEQKQAQEIEEEALVQERIRMEAEIAEMSEEDIDSAEQEFDNYIESLTDEEIEEQFGDYGSKIGTEKSIEGEKGTAVDAEQKDQKGARKLEEKEAKKTQSKRSKQEPDAPSRERSFATRVLQSEDVSQEVKEGLSEDAKRYIPVSNEITVGEANAIIEAKGVEQATKDVLNSKNKMEPRVRVAMALELVKKNNEINTPESLAAATEIANEMSRYATELGQAVQIYSIWSRITPDGMLISYDRNQDDVRKKIKDQNSEFYQGTKSGYRSGNKKAGKKAAKKVFGKSTPKVNKAKAFNLSKEEISQKKKEALARLKKATKGGPLTSGGINVEALEALTDYGFYVFADGVRNFKEWAREMRKATDLKDDDVLRDIWLNKKTDSGKTLEELSQLDSIEDIASEFLAENSDISALSQALQDTFDLDQDLADGLAKELVSEFDKSAARIRKSEIEKKTTGRTSKKVRKAIDEISKTDNLDSEGIDNLIEEAFGVKALTEEQKKEIKDLGEERDKRPEGFLKDEITREMMSKMDKFGGIPKRDIIWSLWYSGVLSGWETQAVNIGANAVNIGMESFVSMIEQSVINRDPQAFASGMSGLMKGMRQGYDEFNEVLREGFSPARVTQKLEVKDTLENVDFWGGKLNPYNYYKYVGRFMTAVDTASYMAAQGMRKQEIAREINRNEGLRGEQLAQKVSEDLNNDKEAYNEAFAQATQEINEVSERANYSRKQKNRLIRIRANEIVSEKVSEEIKTKAENFASFATFNYEPVGILGTIAKALSELGSKLPLFRLIVPFTRVVANVLNQQLDYTPYGYLRAFGLNASARMDASTKASTVRERNRQLIKATIGTIGMFAVKALADMYDEDDDPWFQITGKGPTNFEKKNQLYSQGWKPYSVKIGDTWISYQYTPLGLGLSLVGNWNDAEKYDDLSESSNTGKMGYAMQSSIQGVFDMSFLTGLGSFFDALSTSGDPEKTKDKLLKTFGRTASSFIVPNLIKQVDRVYDPTLYDKTDVSSAILADIPIVNRMSNLKPKLNAFGQSVERTGNRFTTPENQDKIWKFMAKHRVFAPGASPSTKMLDGVVMTQQEFYDYIEISGGIAYDIFSENLDDLDSDFSELENAERQKIVNKVFSMARKRAKGEVYEKYRD